MSWCLCSDCAAIDLLDDGLHIFTLLPGGAGDAASLDRRQEPAKLILVKIARWRIDSVVDDCAIAFGGETDVVAEQLERDAAPVPQEKHRR